MSFSATVSARSRARNQRNDQLRTLPIGDPAGDPVGEDAERLCSSNWVDYQMEKSQLVKV